MSRPITPPAPRQACQLPPCCECGKPDAGVYGFGAPLFSPAKHFCPGCTPSRTGIQALPRTAPAAPAAPSGRIPDLFTSAGAAA
jgi:hypothetical protein